MTTTTLHDVDRKNITSYNWCDLFKNISVSSQYLNLDLHMHATNQKLDLVSPSSSVIFSLEEQREG